MIRLKKKGLHYVGQCLTLSYLIYASELICSLVTLLSLTVLPHVVNMEACGIQCTCAPDDNAYVPAYTHAYSHDYT